MSKESFDIKTIYMKIDSILEKISPKSINEITSDILKQDDISILFNDLLDLLKESVVKYDEDLDDILQGLISKYENGIFWDNISNVLEQKLEAYNQTKFLKEYNLAQRKDIYTLVTENILIQDDRNVILTKILEKDIKNFGMDQYIAMDRLVNTCVTLVIGYNVTLDVFCDDLYELCNIEKNDAISIFGLISNKKQEFQFYYLTRCATILRNNIDTDTDY